MLTLPFSIKICSLGYTEFYLKSGEFNALLSIGHPDGHERAAGPWPACSLSLGIWDDTPYSKRRRSPLFSAEQCYQMIDFAKLIAPGARVLVHCKKGRSRSTAAALILWAARAVSEDDAIKALLANCPKAWPNGWMLKVADAIMDTRLFDAAEACGIVKWGGPKRERAVLTGQHGLHDYLPGQGLPG